MMPISIKRLWWALAIAHLLVAGWTAYTLVFLPGRIGVVGVFACGLAASVLGVALVPGWFYRLRGRVPLAFIAGGWGVLCFGLGLVVQDLWLYAAIYLLTGATGTLVIYTLVEAQTVSTQWVWPALVVMAVGVYIVRAWGLSVYPAVEMTDEPWVMSYAVGYGETGQLYGDLMAGYLPVLNGAWPVIFHAPLAWWMQITQFGLWEARFFFLLFSLPIIYFAATAASNVYGPHVAVTTAIALLASMILAQSARIRPDVIYAAVLALVLFLYTMTLQQQAVWWHGAAGFVAGAGVLVHLNAAPMGLVLLVGLYLPLLWQSPGRAWRWALAFTIGGGLVALLSLARLNELMAAAVSRPAGTADAVVYSLGGHVRNLHLHSKLEFLLIGVGVVAALMRRRTFDLSLVLLLVLGHIVLGIVAKEPYIQYVRQLVPIYGLLIGLTFAQLPGDPRVFSAGILLPLILLGTTLAVPLRHVLSEGGLYLPKPQTVHWVESNIPQGETLLGSHYYYLWLNDYDYTSTHIPNALAKNFTSEDVDAAQIWQDIAPDVVIWDEASPGWMRPQSVWEYIQAEGFVEAAVFEDAVIYTRE